MEKTKRMLLDEEVRRLEKECIESLIDFNTSSMFLVSTLGNYDSNEKAYKDNVLRVEKMLKITEKLIKNIGKDL
tara:strand:+ start:2218 stop:2439 length:222 start_codon:yes stop_codon:yes gene_type:complete